MKCAVVFPKLTWKKFSFAPPVKRRHRRDRLRAVLLPVPLDSEQPACPHPAVAATEIPVWRGCGRTLFLLVYFRGLAASTPTRSSFCRSVANTPVIGVVRSAAGNFGSVDIAAITRCAVIHRGGSGVPISSANRPPHPAEFQNIENAVRHFNQHGVCRFDWEAGSQRRLFDSSARLVGGFRDPGVAHALLFVRAHHAPG